MQDIELYVFDKNMTQYALIDSFESIIWTDRYNEAGDVEIYTPANMDILNSCKRGDYLYYAGSERMMIVENIEISTDVEDGDHVKITGRSLESILDRRIVWKQTTIENSTLQDAIEKILKENIIEPKDAKRKIENFKFIRNDVDEIMDIIPLDAQYTGDTIYDIVKDLCESYDIGWKILYNFDENQFEFSLYVSKDRSYNQEGLNRYYVPDGDTYVSYTYSPTNGKAQTGTTRTWSKTCRTAWVLASPGRYSISFDVADSYWIFAYPNKNQDSYMGDGYIQNNWIDSNTGEFVVRDKCYLRVSLRHKDQKTELPANADFNIKIKKHEDLPYVIFSPAYENIVNSNYLKSEKEYKNITLVAGEGEGKNRKTQVVWNGSEEPSGLDRKELYTDARDLSSDESTSTAKYNKMLAQRGREKLKENKISTSFEGEMETTRMFVYGTDFFLGDIVQVANNYEVESRSRISEIVFSHDKNGKTVVPTFTVLDEDE